MDLLADTLIAAGARGSLGTRIEAGGTWGLWLDTFPGAALHTITAGSVWLSLPDRRPRNSSPGTSCSCRREPDTASPAGRT